MITSTLLSLLLPAFVAAHGYVAKVTIDGTVYQGNTVGTTATIQSPIRQINSNEPVKGASNPNLNCGMGAQLAATSASASPGSSVEVLWVGGTTGTSQWPHNTGPIMHYMAQCEGSCTTYDSSNAKWFKISEQGQVTGGSGWYQAQIAAGSPAKTTIPSNLAAGEYLLRSELITLQLAMTEGGAEFYPSCIQLKVGGSQTGQPTSSEEVNFPGGYSDTDPGIYTPNVYNPGFVYVYPGPPLANFTSGGSATGSSGGSGSGSGASSAPPASSPTTMSMSPSGYGAGPSASSTPSTPANPGGYPSPSGTSATPSPTSTGGSNSTCMRKRSVPAAHVVVDSKRMHRRRYRTSH